MTSDLESRPAARPVALLPRIFTRPSSFLLLIALYLAGQVVVRLLTSNSAELDEAEQLLLTQQLAWGYGPQPPLYTWLQFPFIQLLGPTILALAVFKNLLLFGTYAFTFLSASRLTRNQLLAVAATVSLLFVPQISWESQRDLTHSVLVTMLAAATLYVFLRLGETRRLRFYVAFGICAGLGTLSKYSYLLCLAGLILAALSLGSLRPIILNRGMLLALALGAVLVAPHAVWAWQHQDAVLSTAGKFHIATDRSWFGTVFTGAKNLAGSIAVHIGALAGIWLVVCLKPVFPAPAATVNRDYLHLIARTLGVIFVLLALMIVGLRVTAFKDRWLLPVFICLPVGLAAALETRLNPARVRIMLGLGAAVMVAVSILLPGRIWFAERLNRFDQPNAPFDKLAQGMSPLVGPEAVFVAESPWLGGNLRMFFPRHFVRTPHWPPEFHREAGREYALVWDATRNEAPPEMLTRFASNELGLDSRLNELHYLTAPLKFFRTRTMRLGFAGVSGKAESATGKPGD